MANVIKIRGVSKGDAVTRPSGSAMFFHDAAPMDGVMISVDGKSEIYLSRNTLDAIMGVFVGVEQGNEKTVEVEQWSE